MNLSGDDHGDEEQIGIFLSQLSTLGSVVPLAKFLTKMFFGRRVVFEQSTTKNVVLL